MALFTAQIKTIKGEALAAKALGGQSMEFTRIVLGDGQLSGQSPAELEGLLGEKVSLPVAESYREDNSTWTVGAPFDNKDLSIGFYWREVGVYALDPDEGEILFSYASAQDAPDYIPPLTGGRWEKRIYVSEKVGSAASVTVDASKSVLYAPKEDLLAHVSDLGNPHQVTATQVGAAPSSHLESKGHMFQVTAILTPAGALELTGGLPADKDGLTVQFVSPAAATDGLQMKFAGSDTLYPILTTGEGKEPIQAGAWDIGVPVTLTVSGGSCFFKAGGQGFPPGWNEKGQGIAWDDITKNSPIVQREYGKIEDGLQALPGPDVLPMGVGYGCAFSPDGMYLAVSSYYSPFIIIYKRNGDTFTKLPNPAVLPTGSAERCTFSPDGSYLVVAHDSLTIYKRVGDTFSKLPNPVGLTTGAMRGCSFSPDGNYLAVAHTSSPYLTIYKRDGDIFTKLPNPANLPKGDGRSCTFSPDGNYLVVGYINSSPFMIIYKREGDIFTKLPDPKVLPTGNGLGVAFSPDEHYLAVAHAVSPYLTIYLNEQKTYIHTLNDINKEYFAYAPKGKIGVAKESKPAGELVKATLFPALYNLTNNGNGGN